MKKIIFVLLVGIIGLGSCNEIDDLLTFNINNQVEFSIPSSVNLNTPFPIPTPDVKTNSNQEFENNKTNSKYVKDVKLSTLSLQITNPPNKSFSFLKSVTIYISADGLPEKKIAYLDEIPNDVGSKIDLIPTGEKLDEYIKKESYNVKTGVVTDEALIQEISVKANMTFKVTAKTF